MYIIIEQFVPQCNISNQIEVAVKKGCVLFVSLVFVLGLVTSPVFAGGGKQHGDVGNGVVDQGTTGKDVASAPGNNAQGNMVDP